MGRYRRNGVALAAVWILSAVAFILMVIAFLHPVARLNVPALALVVLAVGAYLRWKLINVHETALKTALAQDRKRQQHAEQRFRGLRTPADSDH